MTEILITSSVLILVLLLMRKVFRNSLSRRVQYALWALVLIRLLIPMNLPAMDFSVLTAAKPVEQTVTENIAAQPIFVPVAQEPLEEHPLARRVPLEHTLTAVGESVWAANTEQQTAVQYRRLAPQTVLTWVWIAGSCAAAAFLLFANIRFWLWLRRVRKPLELEDCKLPVYFVEAGLPSPCLFGLFRPAIYLTPAAVESEDRLRHVLAHEMTHARHFDHLWTFLRGVCLAMYWFDPLVWIAASAAKKDCELACDEGALAKLEEDDRIPYGKTLLSLIPVQQTVNPMLATTAMTQGKKHLKDRITRIAKRSRQTVAAVLAVVLLTVAISACTFTGGKADQPLRLCVDLSLIGNLYEGGPERPAQSFLKMCEEAGGPKDVELEVIPSEGEERDAALKRLRTEIMSGSGPDVFLLNTCSALERGEALFPYPEQAMANGLFLPLDDLMAKSEFTNWEDFIPTVMQVGKSRGKQYLIPAAYTFPVTLCKQADMTQTGEDPRIRSEILSGSDPLLLTSALPSLVVRHPDYTEVKADCFSDLFAPLADYADSKLTFSEEELVSELLRSVELQERGMTGEFDGAPTHSQMNFSAAFSVDSVAGISAQGDPLKFLPLLSEQGNVSAAVTAFAGINANTNYPEEAFFLLDQLFSRAYQTRNTATNITLCNWLYEGCALPVDGKLGQEEYPILSGWWLSAENFQAYCDMRDRITVTRYRTPLDTALDQLFSDCWYTFAYEEIPESEKQEKIKAAASEAYEQMKQMIAES